MKLATKSQVTFVEDCYYIYFGQGLVKIHEDWPLNLRANYKEDAWRIMYKLRKPGGGEANAIFPWRFGRAKDSLIVARTLLKMGVVGRTPSEFLSFISILTRPYLNKKALESLQW